MLAGFAQEFFTRNVEAAILFRHPYKISASTHFIRYKVRGGTFDPPTQGDTIVYIYLYIVELCNLDGFDDVTSSGSKWVRSGDCTGHALR